MNQNKSIQNKEIMDDVVAKAMASKIVFNAKKHRKNQEKYKQSYTSHYDRSSIFV
jgi:hypothetical protein